ncbi:MAG TPA: protein translocase subunit SecF [Armatimonadetes bacterium]|nr:protein translocase subunit SecF [Armatimonadota bacterium]
MDFFSRQNWNIIKYTWLWLSLSILMILVGMGFVVFRGLNWGIDFTGGSLLQYQFENPIASEPGEDIEVVRQTREMLTEMGLGKSQIQVADNDQIYIRTPQVENDTEARSQDQAISAKLTEMFGERGGKLESLGRQTVGPVIGQMLTRSALQALALGSLLILIYITVRYEFRFAVVSILSLLHDMFVLVGIMAILQIELDSWFVAAILTILGYSINDTVVIFDRIRENRSIHRRAPLGAIANASLLQTMARSINTGLTAIFTLSALYFLGGSTIQGFSLSLIIGIAAGAYSSVFNAAPLVVVWHNISERQAGRVRDEAPARRARPAPATAVGPAVESETLEEEPALRPSARQTIREAELAAQEEKRRKRRERRKKETEGRAARGGKKRF